PHGGRLPHAQGGHRGFDVLHGVVDGHPGGHHASHRIDVKIDLFVRVFRFQKEELGDDQVGHVIVDGRAQKDDAVLEEPGIDIISPLPPAALLHYHGNQLHFILRPPWQAAGRYSGWPGPATSSWSFPPAIVASAPPGGHAPDRTCGPRRLPDRAVPPPWPGRRPPRSRPPHCPPDRQCAPGGV